MSELVSIQESPQQGSAQALPDPSRYHARKEGAFRAIPTFAITSGKGGVGKTNIVANLAAALKLKRKRVMVIDADLGLANLDLLLRVKPKYTLADFFSGRASLSQIITINRSGILLVPGASGV